MLGLLFSIPTALATHPPGFGSAPYGVAIMLGGLVTGLLTALIMDTLVPYDAAPPGRRAPQLHRSSEPERPAARESRADTMRQRLAEEKACLDDLDAERRRRRDSGFGKATEEKVIWRELLDLELQEIDEKNRSHL